MGSAASSKWYSTTSDGGVLRAGCTALKYLVAAWEESGMDQDIGLAAVRDQPHS